MAGGYYEFRDPVYGFIVLNDLERDIVNTWPFQRLKYIHQLAMTYQVYHGATHKRFEHSLGVMEMASRAFDQILRRKEREMDLWFDWNHKDKSRLRQILRLAALLHDIGHLPFSHAAEEKLCPPGWNHEKYTAEIIRSVEIRQIIEDEYYEEGIRVDKDIIPIIVSDETPLDATAMFFKELITGDLGADRMDYLIRDSLHTGVFYGRFDYERLLNTLTVWMDEEREIPVLAIERGGIHAAEGLVLARYFMFLQVYFHRVRRIYDRHLQDYLIEILPRGFPKNVNEFLKWTDYRVLDSAAGDLEGGDEGRKLKARRILCREHFRTAWEADKETLDTLPPDFPPKLEEALKKHMPEIETVIDDSTAAPTKFEKAEFLVVDEMRNQAKNILAESAIIEKLGVIRQVRVYAERQHREDVAKFCDEFVEEVRKDERN
jgi:hypothetical protein